MITKSQATLILSHMEPLVLNGGFNHPITPDHFCLSDETMWRLGIKEGALDDHLGGFYDGKDYDKHGRSVHVFLKSKLEKYSGASWQDYEDARQRDKAMMERGG